jgi:hypothetical protein
MSDPALSVWHGEALAAFRTRNWGTSSEIGAVAWRHLPAKTSAKNALSALRELEAIGLVERQDSKSPIIWKATDAGKAYLSRAAS